MHWWRLPDQWSLKRLALVAVSGAAFGAFLLLVGDLAHLPVWLLVLLLVMSALAWLVYYFGKRSVERGLSEGRWTDDERAATGQALRTSARAILLPFCLLFGVTCVVERFIQHRHDLLIAWFPLYLLSMSLGTMRRAIVPPPPVSRDGGWPDAKPIHSEHWGKRAS